MQKTIGLGKYNFRGYQKKDEIYRFTVPNSRQRGELRFGDIRLPIQLFDQSAGGFAAISLVPPGVEHRRHGSVVHGDDWYEIRLVYVTPIDHPDRGGSLNA